MTPEERAAKIVDRHKRWREAGGLLSYGHLEEDIAATIREAEQAARAEEREACAALVDTLANDASDVFDEEGFAALRFARREIRKRGE